MNNDNQLKSVQSKIGKVQGQMQENIELVMQRQENLDTLVDKSSSLQSSANKFSQVATRVRQDQQLQQYKFYAGIAFGVVFIIMCIVFWSSPGKLTISLMVVGIAGLVVLFFFNKRKEGSQVLADSIIRLSQPDLERGRATE